MTKIYLFVKYWTAIMCMHNMICLLLTICVALVMTQVAMQAEGYSTIKAYTMLVGKLCHCPVVFACLPWGERLTPMLGWAACRFTSELSVTTATQLGGAAQTSSTSRHTVLSATTMACNSISDWLCESWKDRRDGNIINDKFITKQLLFLTAFLLLV